METNTWTSTTLLNTSQHSKAKTWTVRVKKANGTERVFHLSHVVLATGFKVGRYVLPYPLSQNGRTLSKLGSMFWFMI